MANSEVVKVDQSAGKITIKHGPIEKLAMDEGMTMVFHANAPALLKQVRAGDKIKFDAENVNVTKIARGNSGNFGAARARPSAMNGC